MRSETTEHHLPATHGAGERRSAEERREQLIDAAVGVITEHGLDRATTRAITDRAGLALGAFHYVFDSKDDLLAAVVLRVQSMVDAEMLAMAGSATAPTGPFDSRVDEVVAVLVPFLQQVWDHFTVEPALQLAQYELTLHALRESGKQHFAVELYGLYAEVVAEVLRDRIAWLEEDTSRSLARDVVAVFDGLLLTWLVRRDDEEARLRAQRCLAALPVVVAENLTA